MQSDDMVAINKYIMTTKINTTKAAKEKDEWLKWYDDLSWYEKTFDGSVFDEARNRRLRFNLANAKSKKDKRAVQQQAKTGVTLEEAQGEVRRTNSEGFYNVPLVSPHTKLKYGVLGLAGLIGGFYVYNWWKK